jgi:hypothetical protein
MRDRPWLLGSATEKLFQVLDCTQGFVGKKRAGGVSLRGNAEVRLGPALISSVEHLNHEFIESTRMIPIKKFSGEAAPYSRLFVLIEVITW